jgi:hypothetical protein
MGSFTITMRWPDHNAILRSGRLPCAPDTVIPKPRPSQNLSLPDVGRCPVNATPHRRTFIHDGGLRVNPTKVLAKLQVSKVIRTRQVLGTSGDGPPTLAARPWATCHVER